MADAHVTFYSREKRVSYQSKSAKLRVSSFILFDTTFHHRRHQIAEHNVTRSTSSSTAGATSMHPQCFYIFDTFRHTSTASMHRRSRKAKLCLRVQPKERHRQRREYNTGRSKGVHERDRLKTERCDDAHDRDECRCHDESSCRHSEAGDSDG